jgi:hypothetical protein
VKVEEMEVNGIVHKLSKLCEKTPFISLNYLNLCELKVVQKQARHWWLRPVILVTQEAEIKRITV